ncbi:peptidoglycan-binding protein [Pseudanabaena sp. PCC 6802]|uniref:peptidoglycan-binding domain-containing protein n=1 Tax=Pseudanabaena sp. PCC 6802 TaxID=118173 RepID=UPI00034BE95A|nr:peptidoglycan-binding protein [Pseudanabaena sp. PCC 6802]
MEFQAFVHGVFASTQSAASDDASRTQDLNFVNAAFKSALTAKVAFYTAIAVAASIGSSLTSLPIFAAEYSASTSDLQSLLASRGFYGGEVDGIAGEKTKQAIIKAQQFYGLNTDGIVGEVTLVALQEDKAESSTDAAIATNISVSDLQNLLAKRGFYKGDIDGVFGTSTKDAVIQAQKFYGLTPDGIVGSKTVAALEADTDAAQTASSLTGDDVVRLQKLLTSRGFYSGPISGFIGNLTKEAILKAQKFYGLTEDGVPGKATFAALEADSEYNKSAKTEDIKHVQSLLAERGFYKGEIDGVLGEGTKEAIRTAQRFYGLTVDGVAGAGTISALSGNKARRVSTHSTPPAKSVTASSDRTATRTTTATRTPSAPEKIASKQPPAKTASKPNSPAKIAAKPAPAKPEVPKAATKPAPTPSKVEKPAASQVTVKPNPTKPVATKTTPAQETTKVTATKPAPTAEKPVASKPAVTKSAPSKEAAKPDLATKPTPADMPKVEDPAPAQPTAVKPTPAASPEVANPLTAPPQPTPETTASIEPSNPTSTKPGTNNKNVQVSDLQKLLATRGFFTGSTTGVMDNETKNAIMRAQSFYGLTPADGDPSSALVESLNRDPFVAKDN